MADQQMSDKNIQIALFVMVVILIGVVIWEEARLSKAVGTLPGIHRIGS